MNMPRLGRGGLTELSLGYFLWVEFFRKDRRTIERKKEFL